MTSIRAALARTYRPRRFAELAMQEHVSETLRAAVSTGRVGHAYLFCGPRGIGKTTAARVLAMALNCPDRTSAGEPCGECDSCERIWSGKTSLDVVEIDAASNRGVDDARDLRTRAMYAPTEETRWKVYIVDEAHMLTREAWNALLKILEEPPPRVIFVFATTEPQKIQQSASPILSRCQRFDFRRISTQGIVARLKTVLAEEQVQAEEAALVAIARRADGGMRDALSLTDQVLSLAGGAIGVQDVVRVLGIVADELYLDLFRLLADRQVGEIFRFVQRVLDEGYDLAEFYKGLADGLRTLIIAQTDGADALEVRDDLKQAWADVAARFGRGDLVRMLAHAAELDTEGRFRKSASPRTLLESLLLSWAYLDATLDLEGLLQGKAPARPAPPAPARTPERSARASAPAPGRPAPAPLPDPGTASGSERPAPRPAAPPPRAASEVAAALRAMTAPAGMGVFLRVAEVAEDRGDVIVLEFPPGPGLERLSAEPATRQAVEQALSAQLGRTVRIEARPQGGEPVPAPLATSSSGAPAPRTRTGAPPARITPEKVKADQLARLSKSEPALGSVVREWDLELLD